MYDAYLARYSEIESSKSVIDTNERIITAASVPTEPVSPRSKVFVIVGGGMGVALGLLLAFVVDIATAGIKMGAEAEQAFGFPVVGNVPLYRFGNRMLQSRARTLAQAIVNEPLSPLSEAIRTIRVSLLLSNQLESPKVIVVTSSVAGEGKSTLSLLLAASSAAAGHRTILVDCDIRGRSISRDFGEQQSGLTDVLAGNADLDSVIVRHPETGCFVLPAGSIIRSPGDLLASPRMAATIERLRDGYDYIVIDTPPLLSVVDGLALAGIADKIIVAIDGRTTRPVSVAEAFRLLRPEARRIAGIVFSKAEPEQLRRYGTQAYAGDYPEGSTLRRRYAWAIGSVLLLAVAGAVAYRPVSVFAHRNSASPLDAMGATVADAVPLATNIAVTARVGRDHSILEVAERNTAIADQAPSPPIESASETTSPTAHPEANSQGDQAISVQADKPAAVATVEGVTGADAVPSQPSQIEPAPDPTVGAADQESLQPKNNASATTSTVALLEADSQGDQAVAVQADKPAAVAPVEGVTVADAAPSQPSQIGPAPDLALGAAGQESLQPKNNASATTSPVALLEANSQGDHPTEAQSDQSVAAAVLSGAVGANAAPPQLSPPRSTPIPASAAAVSAPDAHMPQAVSPNGSLSSPAVQTEAQVDALSTDPYVSSAQSDDGVASLSGVAATNVSDLHPPASSRPASATFSVQTPVSVSSTAATPRGDTIPAPQVPRPPPSVASELPVLLARADAMLALGDIASARLFYERAVSLGSARAAMAVGKTYDSAFLTSIHATGVIPDPAAAEFWYRKGAAQGYPAAANPADAAGAPGDH